MKKLHVCHSCCCALSRLTPTGNNTGPHRLQQAVPRPSEKDIRVRSQEAHNRQGSLTTSLVQGVAHGRRHRSAQDPTRTREEGEAARRRAQVPARTAGSTRGCPSSAGERTSVLEGIMPASSLWTSSDKLDIVSCWLCLPIDSSAFPSHILHLRQRHDALWASVLLPSGLEAFESVSF